MVASELSPKITVIKTARSPVVVGRPGPRIRFSSSFCTDLTESWVVSVPHPPPSDPHEQDGDFFSTLFLQSSLY
uniref:Uncharacterized protein n=1 Tax=Nelumbo nucifera TaxID=4432 RepID=A0A822YCG7_NELNU|nr:TPA_asm: hypothetical protein HUJ06_031625 [Nelumbo nucifera]